MSRLGRWMAVVATGLATMCSSAAAAAPLDFSNRGVLVPLSAREQAAMVRAHRSPHVYRLATVGQLTFFRFGDSGLCYGAKRDFKLVEVSASSVPRVFGGYVCWGTPRPVMDFSVFGASRQHPTMQLWKLQGIAVDQVASIRLLSAKGRVLIAVPVHNNVYALFPVPSGAISLEAVTATGKIVQRLP